MKTNIAALCAVLLVPALGHASSILNETGVGSTQTSPSNPRSGYWYDQINGMVDLSKTVDLRLDVTLTHDVSSLPAQGTRFGNSGATIFSTAIGLDYEASEHVLLGAEVNYSPSSTQRADAPITFDTVQADAQIRSRTSVYGATIQFGYQTAGDSDWETSVDPTLAWTHYESLQQVASLGTSSGSVDTQQILNACARYPRLRGCREFRAAAQQQQAGVNQLRLALSVTETVAEDNEFTLGGSYYVYDQDPTTVGYFSIVAAGRVSGGSGVPLAPLRFTVKPEYLHRFGRFSLDAWYQYGNYVDDQGSTQLIGLKAQYKFSKVVSAYLLGTGQRDVDVQSVASRSGTVALGLKFRF